MSARSGRSGAAHVCRRPLVAAIAAVSLLVGLAACGIPDETDVRVDGQVRSSDYGATYGSGKAPPKRLDSGEDAQQFAIDFLEAAAGESNGVYERVKEYIVPSRQGELKEKQGSEVAINVVRLVEDTPRVEVHDDDTAQVVIPVQQVGVLRSDGTLGPPVATETQYSFRIGKSEAAIGDAKAGAGLYVLNPPPVLLMSTDALKNYYHDQTIYFWNADHTALVPDLRYLPLAVPNERRATEVLGWLIDGPADWLASTAVRLPDGTEQIGTAPRTGDRLEVNLAALPGPNEQAELDRLATQLAWSLYPDLKGELELKIRQQSRTIVNVDDVRQHQPVYQQSEDPQLFCVYGGAVHPLLDTGVPVAPTPLAPEVNRKVVSAALSRGGKGVLAALVTSAENGRFRLETGVGTGVVHDLVQSAQTYASMGRPVWLKTHDSAPRRGLVVADGRLYQFGTDPDREHKLMLTPVALPNAAGPVASVGAALDGNRIAFVAGDAVYVAGLAVDGGAATAGPARRLTISLSNPGSVDWSNENRIVVSGTDPDSNRTAIFEVSVDGAVEASYKGDTGARVTQLSAYPDNVIRSTSTRFMYEANKVSWVQQYGTTNRIGREQLGDVPPTSPPGGSGNPTAPFFFY